MDCYTAYTYITHTPHICNWKQTQNRPRISFASPVLFSSLVSFFLSLHFLAPPPPAVSNAAVWVSSRRLQPNLCLTHTHQVVYGHIYTAAVLWSRKPISALTTFWEAWDRGFKRGRGGEREEDGGGIRRRDVCLEWGSYGESIGGRKIASGMILGLSY